METITKGKLQVRAAWINKVTGNPVEYATLNDKGEQVAAVGHYRIDGPNNGFRLVQVADPNGSERDISPRLSKSRLYEWLWAYQDGIELGLKLAESRK